MNILFMSLIGFDSLKERNIYTDLLRCFVQDGHTVCVVSPIERRYGKSTYVIKEDNCTILRLCTGNIQKTNYIEKGLSTLMLEGQMINGIKRYFSDVTFDWVLYATPPVTFQRVIEYVKKRDGAKTYLMLKDIWPQGLVDLQVIKKHGITRVLYHFFRNKEERLYKVSDYIGCMSPANVNYVLSHNNYIEKERVELCPNAIEPCEEVFDNKKDTDLLTKYEIPTDKVLFVYGGNLGKAQGVDFLLQTIMSCVIKDAYFVIVGNGTEYTYLQETIKLKELKNVRLMMGLPKDEYEQLLKSCDVGMIFLDRRYTIPNYPSRILSYMDKSKPVLAATDLSTDVGLTLQEGKFGLWCESGDIETMIKNIETMMDEKKRLEMGQNAKLYLNNNFSARKVTDIIEQHF